MSAFVTTLSESEYLAIEDAIAATAKGRAFLRYRDGVGRVVGVDHVGQMVRGLKDWIAGEEAAPDRESLARIRQELGSLREHINQAKAEIAGLVGESEPPGVGRIQTATAELDEIVSSTAQATNDILTAAEAINGLADQLVDGAADLGKTIVDRCMDVYQACSFQDITGQRIAKVVATLAHVERRVNAMLAIGDEAAARRPVRAPEVGTLTGSVKSAVNGSATVAHEEKVLLNGPQLPGQGLDQDTIDALLHGGAAPAASAPAAPAPAAPARAAPAPAPAPAATAPEPAPGPVAEPLGQSAIDALFD